MVKLNFFVTRLPSISRDEFERYWRDKHAPLLMAFDEFKVLVLAYSQQHVVPLPEGYPEAPYDGLGEIWVTDAQAAVKALTSALYYDVAAPDEEKFIDRSKTLILLTEEHKVF